jgi:hypothetical protein
MIPAKVEQYNSHFGTGALAFSLGFHQVFSRSYIQVFARVVEGKAICVDLGEDTLARININGKSARG